MGMKFVKIRALPIGLDIGSSAVKMAQLRATGDELELVGACSFDLPKELRAQPRKRLDFIGRNIRSRILKNERLARSGRHKAEPISPAQNIVDGSSLLLA